MTSARDKPIRLLLYALQSPINVGSILRVAETYSTLVDIWDPYGIFRDEQKRRIISDFSCGAYARKAFQLLDRAPDPATGGNRHIATCLQADAVPLPSFVFEAGDVVALGNEYHGLPPGYIAGTAERLRIPMPDTFTPKLASFESIDPTHKVATDPPCGSPVLNVAISAGIICYTGWISVIERLTSRSAQHLQLQYSSNAK